MRIRPHLRALPVLVVLAACSDGAGPDSRIRIVDAMPTTDTALARVETPLVVEVRDAAGRLAEEGTQVWFESQAAEGSDPDDPLRGMYACPATNQICAWWADENNYAVVFNAVATTDAQGRASARIQFGAYAGTGEIVVRVPSLGSSRRLEFTVTPAALAQVVAVPEDTAVYVGAELALEAYAADRLGNERPEPVTITTTTPAVLGVSGGTVTALAHGRGRVQLRAGDVIDESWVSVPPEGRLVAFGWAPDLSTLTQLTLVNTDGTDRRVLLVTHGNNGNANPVWTPDGTRVVFERMDLQLVEGQLHVVDTTTGAHQPLLAGHENFPLEIQPAFSATEGALYFYGTRATPGASGIFRAGADGTDATFLFGGVQPGPSPDGTRVAWTSGTSLVVRDLESGATTTVGEGPVFPRWSPTDDLIAYALASGSEVRVVGADGSGARVLATGSYGAGVSWSADGEWLAVSRWQGGIELIRVVDGVRIPIPGTEDLFEPSWRP
jgi:hypothetical protein